MSTRVITPPSMDLNRDITQNCPDGQPPPPVVAIPESGEGLPQGSATPTSLGCPSPACSPNSSSSSTMFPITGSEHILSMKIRTVPRCLFGPPDPRTAQFAREKVKEMMEQDKNRYNFDFDAEKPLEGRLKWEAVPVAPPTTTNTNSGTYAPKAYALSRFPFLSGSIDRGNVSPPRTTINNNQLPPARQLYFQPGMEREPLLIVRGIEQEIPRSRRLSTPSSLPNTPMKNRFVESPTTKSSMRSSSTGPSSAQVTSYFSHLRHHQSSSESVQDPAILLIPSPEASSCSSEDSAHVGMELGEEEEEEVATSVESSSTEDDMKISNVLSTTNNMSDDIPSANSNTTGALSTSSGISSRLCTSSSSSRTSSISSSTRRTKSVSSSSPSSPSASPSSPTSSQPQITRYMPVVRKRPASTSTGKAASESAPASSASQTETKRAAM